MKFYELYADTCVEDYVALAADSFKEDFIRACNQSEFQYLDRRPIEIELSLDGGIEFPDFIVHDGCVSLVSEKFRRALDGAGVDNLFYKPVTLTFEQLGFAENYYLALPPRIDCLDRAESVIVVEENDYALPEEFLKTVTQIVIAPRRVGNYKIFKLPPFFTNTEIIITEELKKFLEQAALENVNFLEL